MIRRRKKHASRRDWAGAPISAWLNSERGSLNSIYVARPSVGAKASSVAWGTTVTSAPRVPQISLKVLPIDNLRDERYELIRTLWVTLEFEQDRADVITATCYDANAMFGHGSTEIEAIEDLCGAVIECYEDLMATADERLGPVARQLKIYLSATIRRKDAT